MKLMSPLSPESDLEANDMAKTPTLRHDSGITIKQGANTVADTENSFKTDEKKPARGRGRPKAFDPAKVLEKAMITFWKKGYLGTSLDDLTEAMGINRPSLYAEFGNKEKLFVQALEKYHAPYYKTLETLLQQGKSPKSAFHSMLLFHIKYYTNSKTPPGCMITNTILDDHDIGPQCEAANDCLIDIISLFKKFLDDARIDGAISPEIDTRAVTEFYISTIQGLAVMSKAGATEDSLINIVTYSMISFPSQDK